MISLTNEVYINVPGRFFPEAPTQPLIPANSHWIPCCQEGSEVNHG
jgi:hypothetical protein